MGLVHFSIVLTDRERATTDEGTNRRYVQRRMRGAQNTRRQNGVVGSTDTAWERKIISSPLSRGMAFFFYACVISFSCYRPLGVSENLIVFFLFIYFFNLILNFYLFNRSLHIHTHISQTVCIIHTYACIYTLSLENVIMNITILTAGTIQDIRLRENKSIFNFC